MCQVTNVLEPAVAWPRQESAAVLETDASFPDCHYRSLKTASSAHHSCNITDRISQWTVDTEAQHTTCGSSRSNGGGAEDSEDLLLENSVAVAGFNALRSTARCFIAAANLRHISVTPIGVV